MPFTGSNQTSDHGKKKCPLTCRRLYGQPVCKIVLQAVSGQIQDEIDHPGLRIDNPTFLAWFPIRKETWSMGESVGRTVRVNLVFCWIVHNRPGIVCSYSSIPFYVYETK
jgi:hypothetical protein